MYQENKVIIYGAGYIGRQVLWQYYDFKEEKQLLCFAVTDKSKNPDNVLGIPVYCLDELIEDFQDALVIVSASKAYQEEMYSYAKKIGFQNVQYATLKENEIDLERANLKEAVAKWYYFTTEKKLDWNNLRTYNEKMQWLKLYDCIDMKRDLADKYKVREYVKRKIGEEYLVPLLGCWDNASDIDYNILPEEFVLKCNHGSGWNIVVRDKTKTDYNQVTEILTQWMNTNYALICSEIYKRGQCYHQGIF